MTRCSECKKACEPKEITVGGIGWYEFWGSVEFQKDRQVTVSDCCEEEIETGEPIDGDSQQDICLAVDGCC